MGPRAGLDGRKISSPPGIDPRPSSLQSVATLTELPGPPQMPGTTQYSLPEFSIIIYFNAGYISGYFVSMAAIFF